MKNQASASARSIFAPLSLRSSIAGSAVAFRGMLAAGCLGLIAGMAHAQPQLEVGVRSVVLDAPFKKSEPALEHGKVYAILAVDQINSDQKMVRPMDRNVLVNMVGQELNAHGFRQVMKGQKPDILITVNYGRAWLPNPYMGSSQSTESNSFFGGTSPDGGTMATQTITGTGAELFKQQGNGVEAKLQKAQYEKLAIKIIAWEFPKDPKAKAKQLWYTIMNVDDPDHRDLNAIAAKMLEAGSAYFDKQMKEDEVDVIKPLPEGHVNVGTPEVVDAKNPKGK